MIARSGRGCAIGPVSVNKLLSDALQNAMRRVLCAVIRLRQTRSAGQSSQNCHKTNIWHTNSGHMLSMISLAERRTSVLCSFVMN